MTSRVSETTNLGSMIAKRATLGPCLALLLLAAGGSSSPASAASDQQGAEGGSFQLVIPAAEFRSVGISPGSINFNPLTGRLSGTGSGSGCVMAPVYLPDGAVVSQLAATVEDPDPAQTFSIALTKVSNLNGVTTQMAEVDTFGVTGLDVIIDDTITNPTISYPLHAAYLSSCVSNPDLTILSVRIDYSFQP